MKQLTEFETDTLAHLMALQYVLEHVGKSAYIAVGLHSNDVETTRETAQANLDRETFPGLEAVWSDHLAAEIASHTKSIFKRIQEGMREAEIATSQRP